MAAWLPACPSGWPPARLAAWPHLIGPLLPIDSNPGSAFNTFGMLLSSLLLDSAYVDGGHPTLPPGCVRYRKPPTQCTKAQALRRCIDVLAREETLAGDRMALGFLFLYEHFTGTKEVLFRGNKAVSQAANCTFAALTLSFFSDFTTPILFQDNIVHMISNDPDRETIYNFWMILQDA